MKKVWTCLGTTLAVVAAVPAGCSKSTISADSTGTQVAGAGGQSGAGVVAGAAGVGSIGGSSGGASGGGQAGASGAAAAGGLAGSAGAPSMVAFADPSITEFVRKAYCVTPLMWAKDGRADVLTAHDWTPLYASSSEYKAYYALWRIVGGQLTRVAGPISLEPPSGDPPHIGGCMTTDLDQDGTREVVTLDARQWLRPSFPPGKLLFPDVIGDLDGDGQWEAVRVAGDAKTVTGKALSAKDASTWGVGPLLYEIPAAVANGGLYFGDFDGDGQQDVLLYDQYMGHQYQVLRGGPGGPTAGVVGTLEDVFNIIVADMNGDGRDDLVGQGKAGYRVAISGGKGMFEPQLLVGSASVEGVASADGVGISS